MNDYSFVHPSTDTYYCEFSSNGPILRTRSSSPFVQILHTPITYFDYALPSTRGRTLDDMNTFPTHNYRLPLLQPTPAYPDFQLNAPAYEHWQSAFPQDLVYADTAAKPCYIEPPPPPTTPPVTLPPALSVTNPQSPSDGQSQSIIAEFTAFTPILQLQDICDLESLSADAVAAGNQPPASRENLDFTATIMPSSSSAYCGPFSADFLASLPSLSYDDFPHTGSVSENTLFETPTRASCSDSLCFSPTPLPACKVEEEIGPSVPFGIYADVNMREQAWRTISPPLCFNPAEIMTDSLQHWDPSGWAQIGSPTPEPELNLDLTTESTSSPSAAPVCSARSATTTPRPPSPSLSPAPDSRADLSDAALVPEHHFPQEAISAIVSVLKASQIKEEVEDQSLSLPPLSFVKSEVMAPQPLYPSHRQGCAGNDLGMLQSNQASVAASPALQSSVPQTARRVPLAQLRLPQHTAPPYQYTPMVDFSHIDAHTYPQPTSQTPASQPVGPQSPILNAHQGISLEDIRRRAAYYRQQHPNAELDKNFLQCFAGRLSLFGQLQEDYRCYVLGCGQRNRRRDHILVHVGSHVEHRPWACQHCGMRFLRKNECKRHESSHEGLKPFSCHICAPQQEKSFVRQDLLKRHLRVTHGVNDTSRRRAAKKDDDTAEYWV